MKLDRRTVHTVCEIKDCEDTKQKTAYDLKRHMERQHNCNERTVKGRFIYKKVKDDKRSKKKKMSKS